MAGSLRPEEVLSAYAYDKESGSFTHLHSAGGHVAGSYAGSVGSHGVIRLAYRGRYYQMCRVVWLLETGVWPEGKVRHLDGDRSNTRFGNLLYDESLQNCSSTGLYLPDPHSLTPEDLYWLGYFRADGSLSTGSASFSQVHREPVAAFAAYLGLPLCSVKDYVVKTGKYEGKPYYVVWSRALAPVYRSLGVKSDLTDGSIYKSRDFWCGMVDGDGSVCLSLGPNCLPAIGLCGTEPDIRAFSRYCGPVSGREPSVCRTKSAGLFQASLYGRRAVALASELYTPSSFSSLDYKRTLGRQVAAAMGGSK